MCKHYKLRVLIPTKIGNAKIDGKNLVLQEETGFKFWRISLGNPLSPIFPGDDVILDEELPHMFPVQPNPEPTGDFMICTLYADEMPMMRREIPILPAMQEWV